MPNYLDNVDVIDAKGHVTNVQMQDRGTLALAQQIVIDLNNEISAREASEANINTNLDNEITARTNADANLLTLINETTVAVNVKAFGAVGNAKYYNKATRSYWANSGYTVTPTSDVAAVNAAIAYADANNIDIIYFPNGYYYLPNWSYNLDITKHSFVGGGDTALVSSGLTNGQKFITISSPLSLDMYNTAKTPLRNISLWGCYGVGSGVSVSGLYINIAQNVVACHTSFENVVVKDFYTGLNSVQGYKTIFYNFSAIACEVGILLASESAIPQYFIGGYVECCGTGLLNLGTGWCVAVFISYAFEYNLEQVALNYGNKFIGCRFENDPMCLRNGYNITVNGYYNFFDNCDFLFLNNYTSNVGNWIDNPSQYVGTSVIAPIFSGNGEIHFTNCRIALDNMDIDSGFYIVSIPVYVINSTFDVPTAEQSRLIDSTNYKTISNEFIV